MADNLLNQIDKRFNLEGLKNLCLMLKVDFDNLAGETKIGKARELILYMKRQGQLDGLAKAIQLVPPRQADKEFRQIRQQRPRMLNLIEDFWIRDVLAESLGDNEMELVLEKRSIISKELTLLSGRPRPWEELPSDMKVDTVFSELKESLIILGEAGSGKTTLLRLFTRYKLQLAKKDKAFPIPILLNLSDWKGSDQPIKEWLFHELWNKYFVPKKVAGAWLENGEMVLLLDGLDEVAPDYRDDCVACLNTFNGEYSHLFIAICCRTAEFEKLATQLKLPLALRIKPLSDRQIKAYFDKAGEKMARLRDELLRNERLRHMAQTPLMLATIAVTYGSTPERALPANQLTGESQEDHLFSAFTDKMYDQMEDKIFSREQMVNWLSILAKKMNEKSDTSFLIEKLQPSWFYTPRQRWQYVALIRLIPMILLIIIFTLSGAIVILSGSNDGESVGAQILTVFGVSVLCSLAMGLASLLAVRLSGRWAVFLSAGAITAVGPLLGAVFFSEEGAVTSFAVIGFLLGILGGWLGTYLSQMEITTREKLAFSWRQAFWGVPVCLVLGGIIWLLFDRSVSDGVSFGLLVGMIVGLGRGFRRSDVVEKTIVPNQAILWSGRNAFAVGGGVALATIVSFGIGGFVGNELLNGLALGLFLALPVGYALWLAFGGAAVIKHIVLRAILASEGFIPWRLERLLEYAVKLTLLHKVGGGYEFYHPLFQLYYSQQ